MPTTLTRLADAMPILDAEPRSPTRSGASAGDDDAGAASSTKRRLIAAVRGAIWGLGVAANRLLGFATILLALGALAPTPILGVLAYGYLLEVSGRVARTGKLYHGLPGSAVAAKLGGTILGLALVWLPVLWALAWLGNASILDSGGPLEFRFSLLAGALGVGAALHTALALARGGGFMRFANPVGDLLFLRRAWLNRRRKGDPSGIGEEGNGATPWSRLLEAADRVPFLRLAWLGVVGLLCSFAWLALPAVLLAAGRESTPMLLAGGLAMSVVVAHLPFLQARFAAQGRARAFLEWRAVGRAFRRAPILFAATQLLVVVTAAPLYVGAYHVMPDEFLWIPSTIFVAFLLPARWAAGWAIGRASLREEPASPWLVWPMRLVRALAAAAYTVVLFFMPYFAWDGAKVLFTQHAFLLPTPFVASN